MSKAVEYKIVSGDADKVEKQVEELSQCGWKLHGILLFQSNGGVPGGQIFAQAMIKEYEQPGAWG